MHLDCKIGSCQQPVLFVAVQPGSECIKFSASFSQVSDCKAKETPAEETAWTERATDSVATQCPECAGPPNDCWKVGFT